MFDPNHFAEWVSVEARASAASAPAAPPVGADIAALRAHYDAFNRRMLDAALAAYAVDIEQREMAGVPVAVVAPKGGATDSRVLICLHGGAFMWGAGAGALLEAVPLAATMGCEVVTVDYRLAPEHPYPAAVNDALAVYAGICIRVPPSRIGIYGCSAGAVLTAQTVARLIAERRPRPGAIAMLHGAGLEFAGDAAMVAAAFDGREGAGGPPKARDLPYFATADMTDPLVMPGEHPAILTQFPPSLLVSATRDFAASACSVMHRRLLAAGIEARFALFDGLGHAHHMAVDLPESRETFALLAAFFREQLR
ncbi:MAG: alpha/beta hydrolase [Tsuneonella sp.]